MGCGHRGLPSRLEEKRVSRLLRKSGFIPMLDEVDHKRLAKDPSIKLMKQSVDRSGLGFSIDNQVSKLVNLNTNSSIKMNSGSASFHNQNTVMHT